MPDSEGVSHQASTVHNTVTDSRRNIARGATVANQFRPSDRLIDRFRVWKSVCDTLLVCFESMSNIHRHHSSELGRISKFLQDSLPLGSSLFRSEGGLQGVLSGVALHTQSIAQEHDSLSNITTSSIVLHLRQLKQQVKSHIQNIEQDTQKLASLVVIEREKSARLIQSLSKSIKLSEDSPLSLSWQHDPWYRNQLLVQQLRAQIFQENELHKSILTIQTISAQFEEGLVRSIQTAWQTYKRLHQEMQVEVEPHWSMITHWFESMGTLTEWEAFTHREDCLLDPETPLRDVQKINYPGIDHPRILAVHQGVLRRKKRYTKTFKDGYFVATRSGFLHEFKSTDLKSNPVPELSILLSECTLGAPTPQSSRFHQFNVLIDRKNAFHLEPVYTFRTNSHEELMEWWDDLKMLCKVHATPLSPLTRRGLAITAVRELGYDRNEQTEEETTNIQPQDTSSPDEAPGTRSDHINDDSSYSIGEVNSPDAPVVLALNDPVQSTGTLYGLSTHPAQSTGVQSTGVRYVKSAYDLPNKPLDFSTPPSGYQRIHNLRRALSEYDEPTTSFSGFESGRSLTPSPSVVHTTSPQSSNMCTSRFDVLTPVAEDSAELKGDKTFGLYQSLQSAIESKFE